MTSKIGICIDCPKGSSPKPLIAGRCNSHYWKFRASLSANKKSQIAKKEVKKSNDIFFASQILQKPSYCECGCGQRIVFSLAWMQRATIAHIIPKRTKGGAPSVSAHPQNRWFAHPDCHTNFDNLGESWISKNPKLLQLLRDRVKIFYADIAKGELHNVPDYLVPTPNPTT